MYPPASKEFSDWDVLLDFIEDRRVIPIIGSDLVRLSVDGESTTFDHYLAAELAERLGLHAGAKEERLPLNDVVCRYVSSGRGARQDLYPKIRAILRESHSHRRNPCGNSPRSAILICSSRRPSIRSWKRL